MTNTSTNSIVSNIIKQCRALTHTDPDHALALYQQGRPFLAQVDDPCLVAEYESRQGWLLIYAIQDTQAALAHHIRALVETRHPRYADCPHTLYVYVQTLVCYTYYDPRGYAEEIHALIEQLDIMVEGKNHDLWAVIEAMRGDMAELEEDWDQALIHAQNHLVRAETTNTDYRFTCAYLGLASVYCFRGEWKLAIEHAEIALECALEESRYAGFRIRSLLWLALATRKQGDLDISARHLQHALALHRQTPIDPYPSFYDAITWYYVDEQDWQTALTWRDQELAQALKGGSPFWITECYLKRIKLLKALGRVDPSEIAALRDWAAKLIDPESVLTRLSALEVE